MKVLIDLIAEIGSVHDGSFGNAIKLIELSKDVGATAVKVQMHIAEEESIKNAPKVDYKNVKLLKRFVSENGKILPSRITNVSQKKQRELSLSIKRARNLALI